SHWRFTARLIFRQVSALTTFVRLYSASLLVPASVIARRLLASPIFLLRSSLRTLPVAASLILRQASSVCFFPKKGWAFPLPAGLIFLGVFSYPLSKKLPQRKKLILSADMTSARVARHGRILEIE